MRYPGTTAVCGKCGEVYYKADGHNCPRKRSRVIRAAAYVIMWCFTMLDVGLISYAIHRA